MDTVSVRRAATPAAPAPATDRSDPPDQRDPPDRSDPAGRPGSPDQPERSDRRSWRSRGRALASSLRSAALAAAPALAAYALLRLVGLLVLAVFAHRAGHPFWPLLGRFDGMWYQQIANRGYDAAIPLKPDGSLNTTNLAFFPIYPALIALVNPVLPGGSLAAGLAVSWLAGLAAAGGIYTIGAHLRDRRTGIALAALWAVLPHAYVESMAYTETLFTALAAWSLYAVLTRHWLTAGALCLLAGLVRPTASALIAAVGLACLVAAVRQLPWRGAARIPEPGPPGPADAAGRGLQGGVAGTSDRRDGWRPWAAGLLAPLGFLGYLAWVGHRLGRADGYFYVQDQAWGMSFDGGAYTLRTLNKVLTTPQALQPYAVTAVLAVAVLLLALAIMDRQPWPLLVYSGAVLALTVTGGGYYHSKARMLIPAFGLLVPAAVALARARTRVAVAVVSILAFSSAWYGTYLALIWTYSP